MKLSYRVIRCLIIFSFLCVSQTFAQTKIDRRALVERHTVINTKFDSLSSLSVGNGGFAFTVDVTGLQSFPDAYAKGVPLGTQSTWGWHSFIDTANYQFSETLKDYQQAGRKVSYSVQVKDTERKKNAANWFRQNPHRLQLGNVGFVIIKKDGSEAGISDIKNIQQSLNMYTGEVVSKFTVEDVPVEVYTVCDKQDAVAVKINSPLLEQQRIKLKLIFPYPTDSFKDVGVNYNNAAKHQSSFKQPDGKTVFFEHLMDSTKYQVIITSGKSMVIKEKEQHYFLIEPKSTLSNTAEFTCYFLGAYRRMVHSPSFGEAKTNSENSWKQFWQSGAAIDFDGSTDPRAFELERKIILSQYLTKIQCSNQYPPQETGLTYNSWYGKPHLEMHWWHSYHYALWGRIELLEKSLAWYKTVYNNAKAIAQRQGYDGVRWQKMTDNEGRETPSSIGALLIWQQPHVITFAELCYRNYNNKQTLEKYKDLVFATADFMASFAYYDSVKGKYILGKAVIPAQERFKAEETFNPTYELVYWQWALNTAQKWRERLNMPRNKKWDDVLQKLSPLPVQNDKYLFTESATDSYTNPEFRTDHPAVFGALGMLPQSNMLDTGIMHNTFNWIWSNWSWDKTWGWDFPLTAMTATRLGLPDKAIDALLMPIKTNTYLNNGHNYQDDRLTIYLPGNGGLLTAIALMCAGYDGCKTSNPGIPKNGQWKVKWEGLKKMP
jgi:protein-glucosylgalactosylhydroxylysine glucosidase